MKTTLKTRITRIAVSLVCFLLAATGYADSAYECRIDIHSGDRRSGLELVSASRGLSVSHPNWVEEDRRKASLICQGGGLYDEWIDASVSFRYPSGGEVVLNIKGPYVTRDGKKQPIYVHYDNFRAEGFSLRNPSFETWSGDVPAGWQAGSGSKPAEPYRVERGAEVGQRALSVWHDRGMNQVVTLPAGEVVTLTFAYRITTPPPGGPDSLLKNKITDGRLLVAPGDEWQKIDMSDLSVNPGSALDCSRFVDEHQVGEKGRVVIRDGRLEYEKEPGKAARFWGCSVGWRELAPLEDLAAIKAWVEQVKRQGYNMIRPHFLDGYLMTGAKKPFEFNPEHLEKFDYMIKCMKDSGIYLYFDAATSWGLYLPGRAWDHKGKTHYKALMYTDEAAREHYYRGVKKLLTHVNPYTGESLNDDPVMIVLLHYNEQEIYMYQDFVPPAFERPWKAFLSERYGSMSALREAWTTPEAKSYIGNTTSIESLPLFDRNVRFVTGAFGDDLGMFLYRQDTALTRWYREAMNRMGYRGPTTQWDCGKQLRYHLARNEYPIISMHGYHCHPSSTPDSKRKNRVSQDSSLGSGASYFQRIAACRYLDRPFMLTEYLHCYWNRTRFEEGLVAGALAALQGFDSLTAHAHPVYMTGRGATSTFEIALDPVARANQVLTGYLYAAGYARPARSEVLVELKEEDVFGSGAANQELSSELSRLSLLTGFGVGFPSREPTFATAKPEAALVLRGDDVCTVEQLREKGVLGQSNRTDFDAGVFHSETGEILMDCRRLELRVQTPKLEGVTIATKGRRTLKHLDVLSSSSYGTVAVVSLDDRALAKSRRLLLVYNTDALTEGDEFSLDRSVKLVWGRGDTLMKTGQLAATLANDSGGLKLYALALNGERRQELPVSYSGGKLRIRLDTADLKHGPTPFFELVRE